MFSLFACFKTIQHGYSLIESLKTTEYNKANRAQSQTGEDIKKTGVFVTLFLWFVLSSWHCIGKIRSWEKIFSLGDYWKSDVCAFPVRKLKMGMYVWVEAYNGS